MPIIQQSCIKYLISNSLAPIWTPFYIYITKNTKKSRASANRRLKSNMYPKLHSSHGLEQIGDYMCFGKSFWHPNPQEFCLRLVSNFFSDSPMSLETPYYEIFTSFLTILYETFMSYVCYRKIRTTDYLSTI